MTTYGKKKRSLLPFSAFQGEEPNCDQKNNRPGKLDGSIYFGAKPVNV